MPKFLALTVLVIVLDLLSKAIISNHMQLYQSIIIIDGFFNLTLVHNYGAAFSFLADQGGWQRWFFIILSALISLVLLIWLLRLNKQQKLMATALALVLGGALSNLYDRVTLGYVVDFLDVYIRLESGEKHWPVFNLADSAISLGAFLILLDAFWERNRDNDGEKSS